MSPVEVALFGIVYIAAMPAMLPYFSTVEIADPDTDEVYGEAREYDMRAVLMMLFWLPMMVIIVLFHLANFIAGVADSRRGKRPASGDAGKEYLRDVW